MIFGKSVEDLDKSAEAARKELNEHAVYTARMAAIPFGTAALGMVVSPIPQCRSLTFSAGQSGLRFLRKLTAQTSARKLESSSPL